jgi:tetratricopeptide (TPR) repeat protein
VVVFDLRGDTEHQLISVLTSGLTEDPGIQLLRVPCELKADEGAVPEETNRRSHVQAVELLQEANADLAVWGRVLADGDSKALSLHWSTSRSEIEAASRSRHAITSRELRLPADLEGKLSDVLAVVVVAAWAELDAHEAASLSPRLESLIARIEPLLSSPALSGSEKALQRGTIRHVLGSAFGVLGKERGNAEMVIRGLALLQASLPELASAPRAWADTQMNIAAGLMELRTTRLGDAAVEQALAAYREAVAVYREANPARVPVALTNMGLAFTALGESRADSQLLEQGVQIQAEALGTLSRETDPRFRRRVYENLGTTYLAIATLEPSADKFGLAVSSLRQALADTNRDEVLAWATIQINLGNALAGLGELHGGTASLMESATSYSSALEVLSKDRLPHAWGAAQLGLGTVLHEFGVRTNDRATIDRAVDAFSSALEVYNREKTPDAWASAASNRAVSLTKLASPTCETSVLENAVSDLEDVISQLSTSAAPQHLATHLHNLGTTLNSLGECTREVAVLRSSVEAYNDAVDLAPEARSPIQFARTKRNLGNTWLAIAKIEGDAEPLRLAIAAYQESLRARPRDVAPFQWAMTQSALGDALSEVAMRESDESTTSSAMLAYENARAAFMSIGDTRRSKAMERRIASLKAVVE